MATTKTLAPTNQTITIAGFQGEKPDQRQIADAESKLADAVNALNSNFTYSTMTNGTNLNTLTTKANYIVGNMAQMTNAPTDAGSSGFFYVEKSGQYVEQRFVGNLSTTYRMSYDSGSTWTVWDNVVGSWKTRRIHYHTPATSSVSVEGFSFNIGNVNYTCGSFIVLTRFGIHSLLFSTNGSAGIDVRTHVIDAFASETLTASVSGRTVTIKSNTGWNYMDIDGISAQEENVFGFTPVYTT